MTYKRLLKNIICNRKNYAEAILAAERKHNNEDSVEPGGSDTADGHPGTPAGGSISYRDELYIASMHLNLAISTQIY